MRRLRLSTMAAALLSAAATVSADPPVAQFIFPAGGQRGTTVQFRVGGLFLHDGAAFEMAGAGVKAEPRIKPVKTIWFEGPLLPLPESQQAEDYPKDFAGKVAIAADAPLGKRRWRLWTSQGAAPAMRFVVGDLPEIVEDEIDGDPVPVGVTLPVTINGRIFPREDVDVWSFEAKAGQIVTAEAEAARLGSPLEAHLEILDPLGRRIAEGEDSVGGDPYVCFTAPADGRYAVRIADAGYKGGPAYVYRLTLTAGPRVKTVFPLGGRRGTTTAFRPAGPGVPDAPVEIALPARADADRPGSGEHSQRFRFGNQDSNAVALELDDLPELTAPPEAPVALPAVLNGRIASAGAADRWPLALRKGEAVELELRAARLGSPLEAVLTLTDAAGKELARAEAAAPPAIDPKLTFAPPADATYWLRVENRHRTRGGPEYAYRLRATAVAAAGPDFRVRTSVDSVTVVRGTDGKGAEGKLKVEIDRLGGFADALTLELDGLPAGVSVVGTPSIPKGKSDVELKLKAAPEAKIGASHLVIRGTAVIAGKPVSRTAAMAAQPGVPALDSVLLAVAMPVPFAIKADYDMRWAARGTVFRRHYAVERRGFDGPITVTLSDRQARHLQGITAPTVAVPPGADQFEFASFLPPWMETGRTARACIMAVATVRDADGSEHVVSTGSVAQNHQLIAVVEPGRLGADAEPASLIARPGRTAEIRVRINRGKGVGGAVAVELVIPAHLRGLTAEAVTIPAGADECVLTLRFADGAGPFNMPLTIRATARDGNDPVTAETKLDVRPAE